MKCNEHEDRRMWDLSLNVCFGCVVGWLFLIRKIMAAFFFFTAATSKFSPMAYHLCSRSFLDLYPDISYLSAMSLHMLKSLFRFVFDPVSVQQEASPNGNKKA